MALTEGERELLSRGPMDDKLLRRIHAQANAHPGVWTPADDKIMSDYAFRLLVEVDRLRLEARERERELAAAQEVVIQVACLQDRMRDMLKALDAADADKE